MTRPWASGLKLSAFILLSLSLAMALLRALWHDLGWGFLFLFGLQVVLILATLLLMLTSLWKPGNRWNLPAKYAQLPRRIFAPKTSPLAFLHRIGQRLFQTPKYLVQRLFKRPSS
jgi:hypothetical protein